MKLMVAAQHSRTRKDGEKTAAPWEKACRCATTSPLSAMCHFYAPSETLERQMERNPTIGEMADYIASIRYIEADAMLAQRDTDTTER